MWSKLVFVALFGITTVSSAMFPVSRVQDLTNVRQTIEDLEEAALQVPANPERSRDLDIKGDLKEIQQKWMPYFDLVVEIDKGRNAQNLKAYRHLGGDLDNMTPELVMDTSVSTGAEIPECDPGIDEDHPDSRGLTWYASRIASRHTPTGYYPVILLDADHYSKSYHDAHMPMAVKFIPDGIFTHERPKPGSTFESIGHQASHGCVRMYNEEEIVKYRNERGEVIIEQMPERENMNFARDLFTMVLMTGGPFNVESPFLNASCPTISKGTCTPKESEYRKLRKYFTDVFDGKFPATLNGKLPLEKPRTEIPQVVQVSVDGKIYFDPATKQPKTKPGYRTLFIVKNSDVTPSSPVYAPPPPTPEETQACQIKTNAKNASLAAQRNKKLPFGQPPIQPPALPTNQGEGGLAPWNLFNQMRQCNTLFCL